MAKVLIADDERSICDAFRALLEADGHTALVASTGTEALRIVAREHPDAVFLDIRMPGLDGLATLREIAKLDPTLPVTIMTAFGTLDTAAEALRANAFDYLGKPLELEQVRRVLKRALHRPAASAKVAGAALPDRPVLVGSSRPMQEIFKLIVLLAGNDLSVLIEGESGTGKELVARAIHSSGARAAEPFVAVNCAAIPESLIEAELFGHEKGAFTDARDARRGRFEAAGRGTLFLDEIGELPLHLQGKLLRVLQERSFERLGSTAPTPLAARIIAASNRDLASACAAGRFRADLYHRLKVAALRLPPLRERREDLPALCESILAHAAGELGRALPALEAPALERLARHDWPGNTRELEHVLKRSLLTARGATLAVHDLVLEEPRDEGEMPGALERLLERAAEVAVAAARPDALAPQRFDAATALLEAALVRAALTATGGNQAAAAKLLGISRTTFRLKLGAPGAARAPRD